MLALYPSDKHLVSRIYKKTKQIYNKKLNHPIKKGAKDMNRHFSKEDIHAPKKHEKKLNITDFREMQIKATVKSHCTPGKMVFTKQSRNNRCW